MPCLDGLRGIAILMVMMCHFAGDFQQASIPFYGFLRFGSAGVDLFFVLSGFLITGLLYDSRSNSTYYQDFFIRRFLRIIPLYYSVLIVTLIVLPFFQIHIEPKVLGREPLFFCFASNLVQGGPDSVSMGCFGHFWSLAVEEHFYLVWPFVIRASGRRMGLWACAAIIGLSIFSRVIMVSSLDPVTARNAVNYLTPCRIEGLAVGGLIALIARSPSARVLLTRLVSVIVPVIGSVLILLVYRRTEFFALSSTMVVLRSTMCAWVGAAMLIAAVLASPTSLIGRLFSSYPLRKFGQHSYALYVFHFLMMPVFERICPIDLVSNWARSELIGRLAFLTVMMTGSWIMAILSWHLIEKPLLAFKKVWAPKTIRENITDGQMNQLAARLRRAA